MKDHCRREIYIEGGQNALRPGCERSEQVFAVPLFHTDGSWKTTPRQRMDRTSQRSSGRWGRAVFSTSAMFSTTSENDGFR
ncbi:MAG: hypothetical protein D6723_05295 [Acidobacteria bacterium]|nr:MAG: hypothetical protein D6723_05295 [Acidobacteriota bacterium]